MKRPLGVASSRVQYLTENTESSQDAKCVLYWMNSAVRESYNHALEMAVFSATNLKVPLLALYVLDLSYPDWGERHFQFAGEGLVDVSGKLADRGVPFVVLQAQDHKVVGSVVADIAKRANAAHVVADAPLPLHRERAWMTNAVNGCESTGIPLIQVETNVVIPVLEASDKDEHMARTIRPKIHHKWEWYFTRLPMCMLHEKLEQWPEEPLSDYFKWDCDVSSLSGISTRASKVCKYYTGGYDSAVRFLEDFISNKLVFYDKGRSEPSNKYQSQLSPYLRYGHISPIEVALEVRSKKKGGKSIRAGIDSFIEQMVVRRELAYNFCTFNENYDNMKGLPNYAQITLREHAGDERQWNYSYEQLEIAKTHDAYWNAAQLELLVTGKMQGYMRMYWAKKILEWTDTPEKAFEYGIRLNNVYNLDGSDPNSYAGVAWCLGKHDQGWREREIFGKVRYMNDAGLERKFNMAKYVDYAEELAREGLPPEIEKDRTEFGFESGKRKLESGSASGTRKRNR